MILKSSCLLFLWLLLFSFAIADYCGESKSPCTCGHLSDKLTVDCSKSNISEEHLLNIPQDAAFIILDDNVFPTFNISSFSNFTQLTKLSLRRSKVSSVWQPKERSAQPPLEWLDLSDNEISEIKSSNFLPTTIQNITLSKNKISSVSSVALRGLILSSVANLDLSDNKLKDFPKFHGSSRSTLVTFNLSGNSLGDYYLHNISRAEDLFQRLKEVQILDLSRNNIRELHSFLLADMTNLMNLYLCHNNIRDLDEISLRSDQHQLVTFNHWGPDSPIFWFPHGLFSLRFIDLSHNNISSLDIKIFTVENLPSLETINLAFNNFTCDAEMYMFFEAFTTIRSKSLYCHQNKSQRCISFPRNSFPKDFHIQGISSRDNSSGYLCQAPSKLQGVHVLDFPCNDICRQEYLRRLVQYQSWKAYEEFIHEDELSSGFSISIALAVLTVIVISMLVVCYKLDLWRRITGQMRYVQVRRNLLQLEGGDDAVI